MQITPPWPPFSSESNPSPTQPQRAPTRSVLAHPFDGAKPSAPVPPAQPPTQPTAARLPQPARSSKPLPPSRSTASDDGVYRWERLSPGQQEAAWQMVAQMRGAVTQERTRRRRRATLLSLAIILVAALDGLLVYLLSGAPAFWHVL